MVERLIEKKHHCKDCNYYVETEEDEIKYYACCRFPPQRDNRGSWFPRVSYLDWCGEWAPKEEA